MGLRWVVRISLVAEAPGGCHMKPQSGILEFYLTAWSTHHLNSLCNVCLPCCSEHSFPGVCCICHMHGYGSTADLMVCTPWETEWSLVGFGPQLAQCLSRLLAYVQ